MSGYNARSRLKLSKEDSMETHEQARCRPQARPGARIVVRGHQVGELPYLVRGSDDGHVSRLYPDSDADVEHLATRRGRQEVGR